MQAAASGCRLGPVLSRAPGCRPGSCFGHAIGRVLRGRSGRELGGLPGNRFRCTPGRRPGSCFGYAVGRMRGCWPGRYLSRL